MSDAPASGRARFGLGPQNVNVRAQSRRKRNVRQAGSALIARYDWLYGWKPT